jgi:hypothetical protein
MLALRGGPSAGQKGRSMLRPLQQRAALVSGGCGVGHTFVGAGAVEAGDGNADEAEVDRELAAVMVEVVHAHATNAGDAGQVKDFLAAGEEAPIFHDFGVADFAKGFTSGGAVFVKDGQQLLAIGDFGRLVGRATDGRVIQFFCGRDHADPFGNGADVRGQPAERSGFFVRLPTPFVVGYAFEHLAGVFHFFVKFCEHRLTDGHVVLREGDCCGGGIIGE